MDFDFTAVKTTVTKAADVPKQTKNRIGAPNPFTAEFARSDAKMDKEGYGQWLSMTLPGGATSNEKAPYGEVLKKAMSYIATAATAAERGAERRIVDNEDGTVTLHFRSKPRAYRKPKVTEETTEG